MNGSANDFKHTKNACIFIERTSPETESLQR